MENRLVKLAKVNCALMIALLVLGGCTETNPTKTITEYNATNIQRVRNSYSMFATAKGGPPKDMASFLLFLKEDEGAQIRLKRMGIDPENVDEIFKSERDGLPFIIKWGVGGARDSAIVFEAKGVDGKRLVAFYEPRELSDSRCEELLNAKKNR